MGHLTVTHDRLILIFLPKADTQMKVKKNREGARRGVPL